MKAQRYLGLILLLLMALANPALSERGVLYQTSTINALLLGTYDGPTTFGDLKRQGDFGIGTFNGLDGEMIELGGKFYQVTGEGVVKPVPDSAKTPFAAVTHFTPKITRKIDKPLDLAELQAELEKLMPSTNLFYAIRVEGTFSQVKTRSVPRQQKPYKPLVEVTKNQPVFEYRGMRGTLVGFRCPDYVKGLNVPGYHLHFLSSDAHAGGHLLGCRIESGEIALCPIAGFRLDLPQTPEFLSAELAQDKEADLKKAEK